MKRSREDRLSSPEPFPLCSQSGIAAGHFQSPAGAFSSLQCPGSACSLSLLLQDSFPACISFSKLRFCCGNLNWETSIAKTQSGDPWLSNVVMKWSLLSDGERAAARLLAGAMFSSPWAGACAGLFTWRWDICNLLHVEGSQELYELLPPWLPGLTSTAASLHLHWPQRPWVRDCVYQERGWCLILPNLYFDFRVARAWCGSGLGEIQAAVALHRHLSWCIPICTQAASHAVPVKTYSTLPHGSFQRGHRLSSPSTALTGASRGKGLPQDWFFSEKIKTQVLCGFIVNPRQVFHAAALHACVNSSWARRISLPSPFLE